ncbi:MAG: diaminopimelate decarboxylase [Bdellovibrionaceae bacterium]|nr:diaminopimelate decarboxylase [Pseudobdellovibrionaceae bacterium]
MFLYHNKEFILKQGEKLIPLKKIIEKEKPPFYLYDIEGLKNWYQNFLSKSHNKVKVFFSMKSNFNPHVLKALKDEGAGVDIVSEGEALLAQKCGFKAKDIVFSGVGKTVKELEKAVKQKFFQINVESFEELKRLALICLKYKKKARIALRMNPNIDFSSHPYIKTGLKGHKFGLESSELKKILSFIKKNQYLHLQGLSMHIGSQIFDLKPLFKSIRFLKSLYEKLQQEGWPLKVLDIGGGLGVNYQKEDFKEEEKNLKEFGKFLKTLFKGFKGQVITEPGRFLTARFGILCAKIEYIKQSPDKKFIILNTGMNHFLRTALYSDEHRILSLKASSKNLQKYDVVGPICETADCFAKDIFLPELKSGDSLIIADTGAYGFVMSNSYNLQTPVREIAFDKGKKLLKY